MPFGCEHEMLGACKVDVQPFVNYVFIEDQAISCQKLPLFALLRRRASWDCIGIQCRCQQRIVSIGVSEKVVLLSLTMNGENIVSESDDSGSSSMQVEVFINLALQNNVLPSQVVEAIPHQMESLSLTWDFHAVCKKVLGLCRRYFLTTLTWNDARIEAIKAGSVLIDHSC